MDRQENCPGKAAPQDHTLARKTSLLFVSPQVPTNTSNPSAGRSAEMLALLSSQFDVTLACPDPAGELNIDTLRTLELADIITGDTDITLSEGITDPLAATMHHYLSPGREGAFSTELKDKVQREASAYDLLVLDHFYAFYYRPDDYRGRSIYHAHAAHFIDIGSGEDNSSDTLLALEGLRKREIDACASVDHVFAMPADALRLADAGVPFGKLQCALTRSRYRTYKNRPDDFNTTKPQLVYVGYLGDRDNVRSLLWFIRQVLPQLRATMPDISLHLVGNNPSIELLNIAMTDRRIHFHNSLAEARKAGETFRVSIDPLLYESGVDTKLVNALARGTPTVTTRVGISRLRGQSPASVAIAESTQDMALQIQRLLTDKSLWRSMAREGVKYAQQHLPTHDMIFRLRQQLARPALGAITA